MAVGGNGTGAGGAKNLAKVEKDKQQAKKIKKLAKSLPPVPQPTGSRGDSGSGLDRPTPKPKPPGPPNFPKKIPVRPGAPVNRFKSEPSTQAQRSHEHNSRVARNKQLAAQYLTAKEKAGNPLSKLGKAVETKPLKPLPKQKASDIYLKSPAALKAVGFKPEKEGLIQAPLRVPATIAKAGIATAKTVAEKPSTAAQVPADLGKSLLSIPSALIRSGLHPVKAAEAIAHDYSRRYGDLYNNKPGAEKKFIARQKKEGITPEVLDLATATGAAGASAGRSLQTVAEAGRLGKTAEKIATANRPALQLTGKAVEQTPKGKNFFKNAAKHRLDVRRAKKTAKRVETARKKDRSAPLLEAEAQRATAAGTPTVAPLHPKLAARRQRMAVASKKGRAIVRQKVEQQTLDRELYKVAHKTDPYAFKYATQYGIRSSAQAKEILGKHLRNIQDARAKAAKVIAAREEYVHLKESGADTSQAWKALEAAKKDAEGVPRSFYKPVIAKQDEVPHLQRLLKNPQVFDHELLQGAVRAGATASRKVAQESPGISDLQAIERRIRAQRELLGITRKEGESQTQFLERAHKEIQVQGLKPGEYYPSVKREEGRFLNRTVGGSAAMAGPGKYTGSLTLSGREHASLDAFANSLHQEIRRKHNWNLVDKIFHEHTVPWSRDKTASELKDLLDEHNIDHGSVALVNMRKIQDAKKLDAEPEFQDMHMGDVHPEVQKALDEAFVDPAYVLKNPEQFKDTKFAVMPREVANELKSGFQQRNALGRGYRIAKGSASRLLLSNPVWLQFQIASNALTSAIHGTGPISILKAHYKFKEPEWKALESDIGVHKFYDDRAHLGASVNNNAFIDGWRAWQKVGAGSKLRYAAHPVREFFNLFHRGDTAQNNMFRRAVLYNDVKREAYRRMAHDAGRISSTTSRIMNLFKTSDPQKLMDEIVKDPKLFEQHAQAVDDFLGNWTSYTSRERQILGNVMFGGFIRYSTRLAFYTMPMRHPIMYSIALQLGRLEKDELKKIFGTDVPPWEIGNYYSEDGKAKFAATRLNPFANALTQLGTSGGNNLVGSLPPVLAMAIDQFAKENVGQSQPWFLNGKQVDVRQHVNAGTRAKMIGESLLQLSPFYRDVEKYGLPGVVRPLRGKQNTDSGLLFPSPRTYKQKAAVGRNERLKKEQNQASPLAALTPLGQSGTVDIQKARDYAASQKKPAKKKRKGPAFDILGGPAGSHSIEILP